MSWAKWVWNVANQTDTYPTEVLENLTIRPSRDLRPLTDIGFTDENVVCQRYEDWRVQHDDGVKAPDGRIVRRPVRLIARIAMVSKSMVQRGIEQARETRKTQADAQRSCRPL